MKLSDFRHLCDNAFSKEVSLLCFVNFFSFSFASMLKKKTNYVIKTRPRRVYNLAIMRKNF